MQNFADFFKNYLKEHNISYSNAAKMTGIDRTILGRYANGSRKPQNKEMVLKLVEGLQMSPEDGQKMYEAYLRTKTSEEYSVIEAVVNKKYTTAIPCENLAEQQINIYSEEMACNLGGKQEILDVLRYLKRDTACMRLKFGPNFFDFNEDLKTILGNRDEFCLVEQIISLDHIAWQHSERKMKSLVYLLPQLFQQGKYQVYYYYQRERKAKEDAVDINFIITDKGIVFFNNSLTRGFFSNQKLPCSYYTKLFDRMKSKCRMFAESEEEQELSSKMQKMEVSFENKTSGITFFGKKERDGIWMVETERKSAVCVREVEVVQLLWKIIWRN